MFGLRSTDRSVTDICMDVGFSGLGTFSRVFRDVVGEPPSAAVGAVPSRRCRPASPWRGRDRAVSEKRRGSERS